MTRVPNRPTKSPSTTYAENASNRLAAKGPLGLRRFGLVVALLLAVTSFPAGVVLMQAISLHSEVNATAGSLPPRADGKPHAQTLIRDRERIHSMREESYGFWLKIAVGFMIVHLAITTFGFLRPGKDVMGLRGTVIGVLGWSAFVVGIIIGIWI